MKTLGQVAYEALAPAVDDDRNEYLWSDLEPENQDRWQAAAVAVALEHMSRTWAQYVEVVEAAKALYASWKSMDSTDDQHELALEAAIEALQEAERCSEY